MKIVAFNGSPRKNGNTQLLIKEVFTELEANNINIMKVLGENMAWLIEKTRG